MNKLTLLALQKSIKHWEEDFNEDMNDSKCALCKRFPGISFTPCVTRSGVERCPVLKETGPPDCQGTPWVLNPTLEQRKAELVFLRSLLPKEHQT